ncbi:MAG: hypothetical protein ACI85I_000527, partial [Arenicella sp.]
LQNHELHSIPKFTIEPSFLSKQLLYSIPQRAFANAY